MNRQQDEQLASPLAIERALNSGIDDHVRNAMYHAGERKYNQFAPRVLQILESTEDERILETGSWALGKLGYAPALSVLLDLLRHPSLKVVRAASWSLGEIGANTAVGRLRQAYEDWNDNDLRRIIGGALKKIAGGPVRAYAGAVAKRLRPPLSGRPEIRKLVTRLEALDFTTNAAEVVQLRKQLQQLDAEYFHRYMKYIADRPKVVDLLKSRRVYGSEG